MDDNDADDPPSVNDEMRALLESHNLGEHADAIAELGLRSVEDLLSMDDELSRTSTCATCLRNATPLGNDFP